MRYVLLLIFSAIIFPVQAEWAADFPVGAQFPSINAGDQQSKQWSNTELLGPGGLVFFVNRSTSW
jgi:hypothetical protein